MSTIQSLKNFIRHGKQARMVSPHAESATTNVPSKPAAVESDVVESNNKPYSTQEQQEEQQHHHYHHHAHRKSVDAKTKRREAEIQQIVDEERQSRSRMPKYPGLERWALIDKMGDGAFSIVYRAKDLMGEYGEVAIKVVRKYEMNSTQVCTISCSFFFFFFFFFSCFLANPSNPIV